MVNILPRERKAEVLENTNNTRSRRQRKVHHKVKTGCRACKFRRQKCNERKPICSGCSRYSTECIYRIDERLQQTSQCSLNTRSTDAELSLIPSIQSPLTSPSSQLNLGDLELLHQYITSTCIATSQRPEITTYIQMAVPQLAQIYPFVMRGILAKAAMHLSWLRPQCQTHYAMVAVKHHSFAMPEFRSALRDINQENCHALIIYSKTLLWCSFAGYRPYEKQRTLVAGNNWLPDWFYLLRGSCYIVESSRNWIKQGPHILYRLDSTFDFSNSPNDNQITLLTSQLLPLTQSKLCENVLSTLRESFALASMRHHNTPARNAINLWIGQLPDEYMKLLQHKEPWALVALAYFCVLVQQSESVWFMKGHAVRLILSIIERLDGTWRRYTRWPCKKLGVELD